MVEEKYSAGLISQSFWFIEIKKILRLIREGKREDEIKKLCIEENLFGTTNEYRAKRIYGYIWNRVKHLDGKIIELFNESDLSTQKIIAIMRCDRLFFEFIYEVYREKNILGTLTIEDRDANIFFRNKEVQNENIAKWTDRTKKRLKSCYFNYLIDANLITIKDKKKYITPPIFDIAVERYLELVGDFAIVKAITGVN